MENCSDALEALAWHEAAIGEFYKVCQTAFAEQAELFGQLAEEEASHSALLLAAKDFLKDSPEAPFDPLAVPLELTESSTKFIRREIERLKTKTGYTAEDALSVAEKIENSFFEKSVFEAFANSPSVKLRETFYKISGETASHAKAVAKAIRDLKRKQEGEKLV